MRRTGKNTTALEGVQEDSTEKAGFEFIFKRGGNDTGVDEEAIATPIATCY